MTNEEIKTRLRAALAEWSKSDAHENDCVAIGEGMCCCIGNHEPIHNQPSLLYPNPKPHVRFEEMLDFLAEKLVTKAPVAYIATNDFLLDMIVELPTPCSNCKKIARVTGEERSRGKWTCYQCGNVNRYPAEKP